MLYKDQYDLIAEQIAVKIRANDYFKDISVENIIATYLGGRSLSIDRSFSQMTMGS